MNKRADLLLNWYAINGRKLPWRELHDPYAIWISEIMLQQTRVDTVIGYYERWMRRFPHLNDLAIATENEILVLWEGLGYYGRARNLLRTAQIVLEKYQGRFPGNMQQLEQLPGIGRYTAGAIASIAFEADEPTVDSNIKRIYSRVNDIVEDIGSTLAEKQIWALIKEDLPIGRAGDYNQALMDLGASICKSKKPLCNICPIHCTCLARARGVQEERPILHAKTHQPLIFFVAAILRKADKILLVKRPSKGLLGGLWEFPNMRVKEEEQDLDKIMKMIFLENFGIHSEILSQVGVYKHTYSHFRQEMKVYNCKYLSGRLTLGECDWVKISEIPDRPMGKIFRMISKSIVKNEEC